ncbi:fimbrial protein [Acinetobacter gerneri]|uniref:fimbrial protein n=1 Tax=Acinetobacter gerneri TaxID=202952 RepID=UPI002936BBDE|nr:fimbrial protein [Acinetobacter gerneri]MDV2441217.1 fimbrial protein [Acinetobacter gerneri]
MKIKMSHFLVLGLLSALGFESQARCTLVTSINASDSYATALNFGKINLTSVYLQPVGSILGNIVVPSSNYNYGTVQDNSIIWQCDEADLPNIYFLAATNGDEPFGGHVETGLIDHLPDVYATWWQYIGLRQSISGIPLSRYWKKIPITNYEKKNGKINIRLADLPPLEATLYRISQLPSFSRGSFCHLSMIVSGSYSSGKLANGAIRSAILEVEVECNDAMISGTAAGQTAIGFQPSAGAYTAASSLGLLTTQGGVKYLLSDQYGTDPDIATGVGIKLFNAASNKEMNFLNQFALAGGGEDAGWYPVLQGTPYLIGSNASGHKSYMQHYRAELKAIPNTTISAGKVKSTATVLVKIQ